MLHKIKERINKKKTDLSLLSDNGHIQKILDLLVLILFSVYMLYSMSTTSTLFLPFSGRFLECLFVMLFGSAIVRCCFLYFTILNRNQERQHVITLVGLIWMVGIYFTVYCVDRFPFLLFLAALTVGCVGMDYRKLIRLTSLLLAGFLLITLLSSLGGAIDNYVYMKDGYIRSAWGICYPTDFASSIFFLLLIVWGGWGQISDEIMLLGALLGIWISRVIAMSITSTLCCSALAFVIIIRILWQRVPIVGTCLKKQKSVGTLGMIVSFPALAGIMFLLIWAYGKGINAAYIADNLLSGRLRYAWNAYQDYGITLLGTPFEQIGNGFAIFSSTGYNFVDSSYPLILLRYGLLLFITYCVMWPCTVRKVIKAGDWRLALAMTLIALHSFSEHHFIEVNYNLLVVMPFASYTSLNERVGEEAVNKNSTENTKPKKRYKIVGGLLCLTLLVGVFVLPVFLSRMRTVVELLGWTGGGKNGVKVLISLGLWLALDVVGLYCICRSIMCYVMTRVMFQRYTLIAVLCLGMMAGFIWKTEQVMDEGEDRYASMIHEESKILREIIDLAEGNIYVNEIPDLYQRQFPELRRSIFYKDELARHYNITAVMDIDYDSACFINSGFLFAPISEKHAIYTNDKSLIDRLSEKGVHLTGYYNVKKNIDLRKMAWTNGVQYGANDGIMLTGSENSMKYGPYLSLYSGIYSVWYELALNDEKIVSDMKEDEQLGTLCVSAHYGEEILKEQKLFRSQFDENGKCIVEVKFWTESNAGIEFQTLVEEGQSLRLEGLYYARTPSYDIHSFYDQERKKYRDEYYSLEGERITTPEGYASCEYEYNYDRAVKEIRYYDEENCPTLIKAGYAQVKRVLDSKNRVIREDYFGMDGRPILLPQGYAVNEREYDEKNNVTVQRYYDVAGEPVITTWNYAEIHRDFDENRRVIRESYYGTDGRPIDMPQGYAVLEKEYDNAGNVLVHRYCDALGNPVMTTWNYAEVHQEYNNKNQIVRESYYDTEGQLITIPQGYAYNEREYDVAGNAIVQRYCDASGKPVMTAWNCAELHREFDENHRIVKECYFDTNAQPLILPSGQAGEVRTYDAAGNYISQRYIGLNGETIRISAGYAEIRREYNEQHQIIRESYFDVDGQSATLPQGFSINERAYDKFGNVNMHRYCDADGNPVMTTWNYAELHRVFDEKKHIIEESYYGVDGKPIALPVGYAEIHREYNDKDQIIKESYYDVDKAPFTMPQGYSVNEREYDEAGNVTMNRYCDAAGKPVITTWNYAEIHRVYDEKRRIIKETYFDTEGKPMALPSGQAGDTRVYDEVGRLTEQKFIDANSKPIIITSGYAELHREYNDKNQIIRESYYDIVGKPVTNTSGFASDLREYDEAGNVVVQKYFDADGNPVMTTMGYAEIHRIYDDKKQVVSEKRYDTDGKEIPPVS